MSSPTRTMIRRKLILLSSLIFSSLIASAQITYNPSGKTEYTDFERDTLELERVTVTGQGGVRNKVRHLTANTELIGQQQLVRAACCNLGESFTTNPSVDVSYSDAATGARQIKLLGLSGTYVQMLTENVPNLRGAAIPFGLGYIPGLWMQSIQVSKGAASVRNGYESTTGQINIEYLKPQGVDQVKGDLYYDQDGMVDLNVIAGTHLLGNLLGEDATGQSPLSTSLLLHYDDFQREHDMNHDGFLDIPKQRQLNGMWRAAYVSPRWISQLYIRGLREERENGSIQEHYTGGCFGTNQRYGIIINTDRAELQWKNALILDPEHNTSLALMLHGSWHDAETKIGLRQYDVLQKNGYAQLMYETDFTDSHNLSVGASLNHDYFDENNPVFYVGAAADCNAVQRETVPGLYAQYTFKQDEVFSLIAGLRWDHSSLHGGFWTPRMHIKYSPAEWFTLRASAGKGYRTPHLLAENFSLLASSYGIKADKGNGAQSQEEAWNYGVSASLRLPIAGEELELNAEYYYTDFVHQLVFDPYSTQSVNNTDGQSYFYFYDLQGRSFSHTMQIDATYPLFSCLDITAGFRFSDSQTDYRCGRQWRPLTARYKGMLSLGWKSPLEFWQIDLTGQLIGPQQLYNGTKSPTYGMIQAQVTREFRYFSLYLGIDNLTDYMIDNPIIGADHPFGQGFDATQVWGPTDGAMIYGGIRFTFERQ